MRSQTSFFNNYYNYKNVDEIHIPLVDIFGEVNGTVYSPLAENTVLTSDTTLFCVTENGNTPQVVWRYVDLFGIRTELTSTTDVYTGVSTIQVNTTRPGYYTCEVSQNGAMSTVTYSVIMKWSGKYIEHRNEFHFNHNLKDKLVFD